MAKILSLVCVLGLLHVAIGQDLDNCLSISDCFTYYEGDCNVDGRRLVCLTWANLPGCVHDPLVRLDRVCLMNNFASSQTLGVNEQICTPQNGLIPGGTVFTFGIDDGVRHNNNVGSGPITILGFPGNPAMCDGYTNVCASGGNNDIALRFRVSPCEPDTTTTTMPMTTTTMMINCECDPWIDWTPCSVTCETGTREERRTCRNCPPEVEVIRQAPCTVPRSCSVNGNWGQWMQWVGCSATCGHGGSRTRSRICNNPPPSGPDGLTCPPPGTQSEACPPRVPCTTTTTRPPITRRECRMAARRHCRRGRPGRRCRIEFVRRCLIHGL